jgi:hypothetical protein
LAARGLRERRPDERFSDARGDGTYRCELQRLARFDVLVLDDFLIGPMTDIERRDLRLDRRAHAAWCESRVGGRRIADVLLLYDFTVQGRVPRGRRTTIGRRQRAP